MIEVSGVRIGSGLVSVAVRPGELVAVCGQSAALLLDLVSGERRPESGSVRVGGLDPYSERSRLTVGVLGADGGLYGDLALDEIVGAWRNWSTHPLDDDTITALTGLRRRGGVPYSRLTPGEQRRFDLTMIMISRPDALVVDEPATGLDAEESRAMWHLIRSLRLPVLVATRSLYEARKADRAVLLDPASAPLAA